MMNLVPFMIIKVGFTYEKLLYDQSPQIALLQNWKGK